MGEWHDVFDGDPEKEGDYWIYDTLQGFVKAHYYGKKTRFGFYFYVRYWAEILPLPWKEQADD